MQCYYSWWPTQIAVELAREGSWTLNMVAFFGTVSEGIMKAKAGVLNRIENRMVRGSNLKDESK